jgi:hypothetical protein
MKSEAAAIIASAIPTHGTGEAIDEPDCSSAVTGLK